MNVNVRSEQFGDIVRWDSLTEEQKASGDWIELPDVIGEPHRARKDDVGSLRRLLESKGDLVHALEMKHREILMKRGQFDAVGKPR